MPRSSTSWRGSLAREGLEDVSGNSELDRFAVESSHHPSYGSTTTPLVVAKGKNRASVSSSSASVSTSPGRFMLDHDEKMRTPETPRPTPTGTGKREKAVVRGEEEELAEPPSGIRSINSGAASPVSNGMASGLRQKSNRNTDVTRTESSRDDKHVPSSRSTRPLWMKPSLKLENSGSVARDHLASERTFLAYVRTSLAIASTGVALVQLFTVSATASAQTFSDTARRIHTYAPALGATVIVFGMSVLVIGVIRFFTVQNALIKGKFPVARVLVAVIALVLAVLVLIVFGILVAGRR